MKKLIPILLILASCAKQSVTNNEVIQPSYSGIYNSIDGDTAYVEKGNGIYTQIRWASMGNGAKITFDSVMVNDNLSLSDNETVLYFENSSSIGTGLFSNNTLSFTFTLGRGGQVIFNGIKR